MTRAAPRTIPRPATVGLGLILLLLPLNAALSEWNLRRLVENGHLVVQAQVELTALEEVLARVTEAEAAERGFLLTNDADYLPSYEAAVAQTWEALDRLKG